MSTIAFVEKLSTKSGTNKNGNPYTLHSMKLLGKDGKELPGWYQCGFDAPPCKEGDYIKLEATPKGNNFEVTAGSIKVNKNPPAKPENQDAPKNKGGGKGGRSGGPKVTQSELFGTIGGYNTEDDIRRMSYSAARSDALEATKLLLENGGLKLVKADTKAGAAQRFEVITGTIDKLTVQFFFDAATGRKLETVADSEIDTSGDGDLPDANEEPEGEDDGFEDDGFEGEDDGFEDDDGDFE